MLNFLSENCNHYYYFDSLTIDILSQICRKKDLVLLSIEELHHIISYQIVISKNQFPHQDSLSNFSFKLLWTK